MKIIVYGVGKIGKEFIGDVSELFEDIEIIAITDSFVQKADLQDDISIPYIKASYINEYRFEYIVIASKKYYCEIEKRLLSQGIKKEKIKSVDEIWQFYGKKYANYYCNLCDNSVFGWKYIGEDEEVFSCKNIRGASRRRGGCPICGSSDRERYVYAILKKHTNFFNGLKYSVLHFAPEVMLSQKIHLKGGEYISADIMPGRADIVVDITKIQFSDRKFDYIICNHVMEHISMEEKAFSEMKRCLKCGGILVLTVPICWEQDTFEDDNINTENDRIKYYGQKDHVRLYGRDIVKRIENFGFKVDLYRSDEVIRECDRKKLGYIEKDSVLLCRRNQ